MTLHDLKQITAKEPAKRIELRLPDGTPVPPSFHITEVANVRKTLMDCGGRIHTEESAQLQAWNGSDAGHRLTGRKVATILSEAAPLFSSDDVPVDFEYEDTVISQYRFHDAEVDGDRIALKLRSKHTDCRAKDVCSQLPAANPCCGGGSACAA